MAQPTVNGANSNGQRAQPPHPVIAIVIHRAAEVPQLIRWASHLARARAADVLVLHPIEGKGAPHVSEVALTGKHPDEKSSLVVSAVRKAVAQVPELSPADPDADASEPGTEVARISMKVLRHAHPIDAVLAELAARKVQLLVIPSYEAAAAGDGETGLERQLFRRARCQTLLLRPGTQMGECCEHILVPVLDDAHSRAALRLARDLATHCNGRLTALYVEPEVGTDAELVGRRILERLVARALGSDIGRVVEQVVVASARSAGIAAAYEDRHHLVLSGTEKPRLIRRTLFGTMPATVMNRADGPAIAVIRAAKPITNRIRESLENTFKRVVPQLERSNRVALVERVQSNSQWDFDFIALMGLSTLIAALGLTQNSAAVVIGAMLVAPLMTPLLGIGLALVQGNPILIRRALRSVLFGFLLAFTIGASLGLLLPGFVAPTSEMLGRTAPGVLDLLIAFASGVAAAYATSRPNLSAALPGVAIAAALVPPIATAGLAIAIGQPTAALGAAVLFFTNMVAIALGAAAALWAVGVRTLHQHGRPATWTVAGASVLLLVALALVPSLNLMTPVFGHRHVPPGLIAAVDRSIVERAPQTRRVSVEYGESRSPLELVVTVAASALPSTELVDGLAVLARHHLGVAVRVRVVTELVMEAVR